ncbi:MAG: MOSC N-terminal beta barrel domain-containing protein [Candidatus Limnocylindrales bacterium]
MTTVTRLSIAPVRSLALEHPTEIELTPRGVAEDRRFYLIDERDHLVDRIVAGRLVQASAHTDPAAETLRVTLPDGTVIEDDVRLGEGLETPLHGRTAAGHVVIGPWAEALAPLAGCPVRLMRTDRIGGTRSANPASIISQGSVAELARQLGVPSVDARRFRMLIELDGSVPHHEDDWIDRRIALGETILRATERDARCAITTQDPDTGERDLDTLRTILRYRGPLPDRHGAPKAMLGVLAQVEQPGRVRLGDEVRLLD